MMNFTPKEIVSLLDKYIIGQAKAKKAVAVALRNRYRRSKLSAEVREEITPKNIVMRGPTGVGKTEIARRLAKLVGAPFIKVEATKYTEVGYVGRDVESMVRDLVEVAVRMVKDQKKKEVEAKILPIVENKIVDALYQNRRVVSVDVNREKLLEDLKAGKCEDETVEVLVLETPKPVMALGGSEINLGSMFEGLTPPKHKKKKMTVKHAREALLQEESDKIIDMDNVNEEAITLAEEQGIIFIDEIDKIIGKSQATNSADVSREGVQRDILPIVEGSTVPTKYGNVKTDFILFIAAGAFQIAQMEDMIPELQGRFPIRVELESLTKEDFKKILKTPKNAVTVQYANLLKVDNINLVFTDDALDVIAEMAAAENETSEDLGARRLHTIMEALLEDVSFNATGEHPMLDVLIDANYVRTVFKDREVKYNLKKYVL
ncbi:MAG: ATP-dependent protease ATPase subunit HslU [Clostridiales bacterium]|nr:ATP-dependent protease ATPase subunit HslU [Clostridiales bacterium]